MVQEQCKYVEQSYTYINSAGSSAVILQGAYLDTIANADLLATLPPSYVSNQCSPSPVLAAFFFTVYIIVITLIMVDLITGIIIENLESFVKLDGMATVTQFHVEDFVNKWEELDPLGTGFIQAEHFTALLDGVDPPLGVRGVKKGKGLEVQAVTYETNIPLRNLRFHFLETLHRLCSRVAHADLPEQEEFAIKGKMIRRLPMDEQEPKYTLGDFYTCSSVTTHIKGFLIRDRLKPLWDEFSDEEFIYEDEVEEEEELIVKGRHQKSSLSMSLGNSGHLKSVTMKVNSSGGSVEGSASSLSRYDRMALLEIASGPNRPLTAGKQAKSRFGTTGGGASPQAQFQTRPLSASPQLPLSFPSASPPLASSATLPKGYETRESAVRPSKIQVSQHGAQHGAQHGTYENLGSLQRRTSLAASKPSSSSTALKIEAQMSISSITPMQSGPAQADINPHPFDPHPHDQCLPGAAGLGSSQGTRVSSSPTSGPIQDPPMAATVICEPSRSRIYSNPLAEVLDGGSERGHTRDLIKMLSKFASSKNTRKSMAGDEE